MKINKKVLRDKARNKYREISEEGKNMEERRKRIWRIWERIWGEHGINRYQNMSEENK